MNISNYPLPRIATSVLALVCTLCLQLPAQAELSTDDNEYVTFYHHDALGSPILVSDEKGRVLWFQNSEPYGKDLGRKARDGRGHGDNTLKQASSPIGYTGHITDTASDLVYMKARHYDQELGRFMQNDPIGYTSSNPTMSFNRYAYANNNPYKYVDPDGRTPDLLYSTDPAAYTRMIGDFIGADPSTKAGSQQIADYNSEIASMQLGALGILGGLGLAGRFAKTTVFSRKAKIDDLLKAGQKADKNGLTKAGRALQKHGDRDGSAFPKSKGNAAARNRQGQEVLEDILNSNDQTTEPNRFGGSDIYDNATGRGVRFDGDGAMKGFLEP